MASETYACPQGHETSAPKQPKSCPHYHLGSPCGLQVKIIGRRPRSKA